MWIFDGICFFIFVLFHFFVPVRVEIILSPIDTEALVGENVTMFCSTSSGNCEWYHRPIGATRDELVYQEGFIYNGYKERFNVTEKEDRTCNLLIENVTITDAGLFTCMEVSDTQTQKRADLIVFENYPSDDSCALKIICNPLCDYMELFCLMTSYGNISPYMEWKDSKGNLLDTITDNTISVIHVDEDLSRHLNYTCYVKYPDNSISSKLRWSYSTSVYLAYKSSDKTEESCWRPIIFYSVGSYAIIVTITFLLFLSKGGLSLPGCNVIKNSKNDPGSEGNGNKEDHTRLQDGEPDATNDDDSQANSLSERNSLQGESSLLKRSGLNINPEIVKRQRPMLSS